MRKINKNNMKRYLGILSDENRSTEEAHEAAKKILAQNGIAFNEVEVGGHNIDSDYLFVDVKEYTIKKGRISTAAIQRMFRVGYSRAATLMDMLEEDGIVGEADGAKPREVLMK